MQLQLSQTETTGTSHQPDSGTIPVWDPFLRLFHWALGLAVLIALVTATLLGRAWIGLHVAAGITALVLVALRIIWGFFGPGPARFSGFVTLNMRELRRHLTALRDNSAPRFIGHNPLGGLMVIALLGTIIALAASGAVALGGLFAIGPLAGFVSAPAGEISALLHALLGNGIMVLIALHLAGVLFESRRHGENLAGAMITGVKERRAGDRVPAPQRARVLGASLLGLGVIAGGWMAADALSAVPKRALPVAPAAFDPVFAEECSACHMLYNPALLPAADWKRLMATLPDHFGEDASLSPEATARITQWLTAHAGETADIRASRSFRLPEKPGGGLGAITDGAAWREYHDDLPQAVFARKAVRSPANCQACHRDAEAGIFSPYAIDVPKE